MRERGKEACMTSGEQTSEIQALAKLLASLHGTGNDRHFMEAVQGITDKLDIAFDPQPTSLRDEHGRLLNEDGLPMVEIVEPDTGSSGDRLLSNVALPLALRQPTWKEERDRILDDLEHEEILDEERSHAEQGLLAANESAERMENARIIREQSDVLSEPTKGKTTIGLVPGFQAAGSVIWGDVIPARLRSALHQPPSVRKVVEAVSPTRSTQNISDSDDESVASLAMTEDVLAQDNLDIDDVIHQREIVLEYHRKRGELTSKMGLASTGWNIDQEDVHQDVTLAHPLKTSTSRFESSRTSISALLSADHGLSTSLKLGRIEDGKLIPADDDSDEAVIGEESVVRAALKSGVYLPDTPQSTPARQVREVRPPEVTTSGIAPSGDAFAVVARNVKERQVNYGRYSSQTPINNSREVKKISRFKAERM